ncbi:MAG: hypothetical protein WBE26_14205 [Phycisphaerae bacterium]
MSALNYHNPEPPPKPEEESFAADERKFLSNLLDELAKEDRAAHDALLKANPGLLEYDRESENTRERIRAALAGQAETALSQEQERLIEHTRASLAEYREDTGRTASFGVLDEPPGILTSMTRKLPPERAIELYRKITPIVVHQVLNRLKPSANLGVVQRLVDHLCSNEVHLRLRACEHVRDGILHELCTVLGQSEIRQEVSREDLQGVLEECGAMDDLIAMENCIRLAAAKAS